jgi:membrane-bound lytic murein transglycosylase MltF
MLKITTLLFSLGLSFCIIPNNTQASHAQAPSWQLVVHQDLKQNTRQHFAQRSLLVFDHFLKDALQGQGKQAFYNTIKRVKNNISWTGKRGLNRYNQAFQTSYPVIKQYDNYTIPETVFLIPYMESFWRANGGKKTADYGYWQLIPEVVKEIRTLDHAPTTLKQADVDTIRTDPNLSTQAAIIHLKRYYFYFANVAEFPESEAWLFTMQAYNWGAGNVKRALIAMEKQGITQNFSNFYTFLYQQHRQSPQDKSLKAAVEYLPSLYNIAKVIKVYNS